MLGIFHLWVINTNSFGLIDGWWMVVVMKMFGELDTIVRGLFFSKFELIFRPISQGAKCYQNNKNLLNFSIHMIISAYFQIAMLNIIIMMNEKSGIVHIKICQLPTSHSSHISTVPNDSLKQMPCLLPVPCTPAQLSNNKCNSREILIA